VSDQAAHGKGDAGQPTLPDFACHLLAVGGKFGPGRFIPPLPGCWNWVGKVFVLYGPVSTGCVAIICMMPAGASLAARSAFMVRTSESM